MARQRSHTHYEQLKNKWIFRHDTVRQNLWDKHKDSLHWLVNQTKHAAVGSLGSMLLLATPLAGTLTTPNLFANQHTNVKLAQSDFLSALKESLPSEVRPLTFREEQDITSLLSKTYGVKITATLEGKALARNYGLIGQEQHLMRFPGDTMSTHFSSQEDADKYGAQGMAPGRGAWGYFANSKEAMTEKDIEREKYYIAVQTFLAPDFNQQVAQYRDFFKYRKMLVVNPENGKAIIVVIGDAGPGVSTGKHLGGSPEVMKYLERVDGAQKGPVLFFFIDDKNDTIPLGPVTIGETFT